MVWGYAHVWFGEFLKLDAEPMLARLKFVNEWGLRCTGLNSAALLALDEQQLNAILEYVAEHNLVANVAVEGGVFERVGDEVRPVDADAFARHRDALLELLGRHAGALNTMLVTGLAGPVHRFLSSPTLAEQLDVMRARFQPLADGLASLGLKLGIENHADFYVSDVVELCGSMSNVGVFLDTGNTYLVGERPLPAIKQGAPYAVGTHFKDQLVRPVTNASPIHFEVAPAVTGEGHVPLREAYRILREQAPDPDRLVMEIELIPPKGVTPTEAMRRSVDFIRSLESEIG